MWLLLAACAACQGNPTPGVAVTRGDSAGIAVVSSTITAREDVPEWVVSPHPDLELDPAQHGDRDQRRDSVSATAALHGNIAVVGRYVRLFGSDGAWLTTVGAGTAPMFRQPVVVRSQRAQSLLVHDALLRRFTRIDADGSVAEVIEASRTGAPAIAAVGDRVLTFHTVPESGGAPGVREWPAGFAVLDLRSGWQDTIGRFPGQLHYKTLTLGAPARVLPVPFDVMPSAAAGAESFFITPGEHAEIREYDRSARLVRVVRLNEPVLAVTRTAFDSAADRQARLRAAADDSLDADRYRAVYDSMPLPAVRPAFDRLIVDEAGFIWARRYDPNTDAATTWVVFSDDGELRSIVVMPAGFEVDEIGEHYILGRTARVGSPGKELVQRYLLTRRL